MKEVDESNVSNGHDDMSVYKESDEKLSVASTYSSRGASPQPNSTARSHLSGSDASIVSKVVKGKTLSAPRRPKTAYMLFLESSRKPYFEKHPTATFNEYQKYAGKLWRSYSQKEKMPWIQSELVARKEFFKEMNDLQNSLGIVKDDPGDSGTTAPTIEERKPSGPKTAFPMFVQAMRDKVLAQNPDYSYNQIQKELSKQWRTMSREEKQVWVQMEKDVKAQRESDNVSSDGSKKGLCKKGLSLPRGPRSAYTLFYQCARKQLSVERPELSFREFPTICSQLWRNMPDDERALWQADAVRDRERYEKELLAVASGQSMNPSNSVRSLKRPSNLVSGENDDKSEVDDDQVPNFSNDNKRWKQFHDDERDQQDRYMEAHIPTRSLNGMPVSLMNRRGSGSDSEESLLGAMHTDGAGHDLPPLPSLKSRDICDRDSPYIDFDYITGSSDPALFGDHPTDMDGSMLLQSHFSNSNPSSTKSTDDFRHFLLSSDDIFGHESGLFNMS
mmetsp:Transcript_21470/g.31140  ORF Transcript_21470/g.31140 Transcript_21470/m.31140 type:complete len:502 (-) Transcript_21470:281-1786(-)|eukprot:CAMPEP_0185020828 /NCGR_PEP_ID=MMETSP1103-20130426/3475_1 /TAXON_ID=36769 /ORGANISM="Paraphysomonas bandaiensis, Strain Caron Lab Isolate" /LENGTH=501 /DNA_ID=CAMNT_0027551979 /DNA_START=113 /DNA_END=1618 /DNA_ORIENTATION=-